jgi:hypothetical protein
MSVSWDARPNSTRSTKKSLTQGYILRGVTDEIIARALSMGYSPLLHDNLYRSDIALDRRTPDVWHVNVTYGTIDKKEPVAGEWEWGFDTTGKTKHVTQAIDTVTSYTPSGLATIDHKGAIGVQDDGSVEGVDVPDASFKWWERHQLLLSDYGWAYSAILGAYTGFKNQYEFRGKDAGTVIFHGATGSQSSKDPDLLELTFNFEYSPDASSLTVGDITVTSKPGWDYLSIRYESDEDATAKKTTPKPRQADVCPVVYTVDFSLFGIG